MSRFTDTAYLLGDQYRDATRLRARLALHERFSTSPAPWHRWLFERIAPAAGGRVLEVGCGSGALWQRNSDRLPPASHVTLTDFSAGMLREARDALAPLPLDVCHAVADVQAAPFRPAAFDLVIANHMLYHVPDLGRALRELRLLVADGGRLVAATNGRGHLQELMEALRGFLSYEESHDSAERFGLESGEALLKEHFSSVTVERYDDALAVTDAEAVVDYARSVTDAPGIEALREHVSDRIKRDGAFRITKAACVLVARP